jgi:hypothetical protein
MNNFEAAMVAGAIKFWVNTITLGLFRLAVIAACVKYIWS